jgi:NAD(P)H-dependent FMN reductase
MKSHDGLLIASPEFNSSITPMLKNAIDWASIRADGEQRLACFQGKVAGIMGTSPGAIGGLRGLVHLRSILGNIQVMVLPDQKALPNAHSAFGDDGDVVDEKDRAAVKRIGARVVEVLGRLL